MHGLKIEKLNLKSPWLYCRIHLINRVVALLLKPEVLEAAAAARSKLIYLTRTHYSSAYFKTTPHIEQVQAPSTT